MSQPPNLTPKDLGKSRNFISYAEESKHEKALEIINNLTVWEILLNFLALAEANTNSFLLLAGHVKNAKGRFCAEIVKNGRMPCNIYSGVFDADYDGARQFILLTKTKRKSFVEKHWPKLEDWAQSVPFYPEMYRKYPNIRDRVCAIASIHAMPPLSGPEHSRHIVLFSLGAWLDWDKAKASSQVSSTCIVFIRAVLHAAGWNVIMPGTAYNVPAGLGNLPLNKTAIVNGSTLNHGCTPEPGDFFHLQGKPFKGVNDSSHVGIIVQRPLIDPWKDLIQYWTVVEGGQSPNNKWTKLHHKEFIKRGQPYPPKSKLYFGFKEDTTGMGRTIQKFYDLELLDKYRWMTLS